jgi:thiamine-monophosphate kinase
LLDCPAGRRLVLTTDALVAGVHFLPDDPSDLIARKLVRVNLSDLAAMGAEPMVLLLAACFPADADLPWIEGFAAGLAADCKSAHVGLIGGDTVATPGPATFAMTAVGSVETGRELRRSNAQIGDRIYVSGTIGDGAFGLLVARGLAASLSEEDRAFLLDRYRLPVPRIALGRALIGVASAAMDISDGLVGDLEHICVASGVGAVLEAARVPLSASARAAIAAGLGHGLGTALTGGDDYELLFTAPADADTRLALIGSSLGLNLTAIGTIIAGIGVRVLGPDGSVFALPARGYRHFVS